jgi:hypothetical protein
MATTRLEGTPYYDGNQWYIVKEGAKTPKHKGQTIDRANPPADSRLVVEGIHIESDRGEWRVLMPTLRMQAMAVKVGARTAKAAAAPAARTQKASVAAPRPRSRSGSRSPATRRLPRRPAYEGYSKAAENAAFKELRALGIGRRKPGQTVRVSPASRSRSRSRSRAARAPRTVRAPAGYGFIGDKRRKGLDEGAFGPVGPYRSAALFGPSRRGRGTVRMGSANIQAALARIRSRRALPARRFSLSPLSSSPKYNSNSNSELFDELRARPGPVPASMAASMAFRPVAASASRPVAASASPVYQLGPPRRVSNSSSGSGSSSSSSSNTSSNSAGSFLD